MKFAIFVFLPLIAAVPFKRFENSTTADFNPEVSSSSAGDTTVTMYITQYQTLTSGSSTLVIPVATSQVVSTSLAANSADLGVTEDSNTCSKETVTETATVTATETATVTVTSGAHSGSGAGSGAGSNGSGSSKSDSYPVTATLINGDSTTTITTTIPFVVSSYSLLSTVASSYFNSTTTDFNSTNYKF